MTDDTTRLDPDTCPHCGELLDAATPSPLNRDAKPRKGDVSICLTCAGPLVFGDDLKVRKPDAFEDLWLASSYHFQVMRDAIRDLIAKRGKQ